MTTLDQDRNIYRWALAFVVVLAMFMLTARLFPEVGLVLSVGLAMAGTGYLVWKGWIEKRPPEGSGPSTGGSTSAFSKSSLEQ